MLYKASVNGSAFCLVNKRLTDLLVFCADVMIVNPIRKRLRRALDFIADART